MQDLFCPLYDSTPHKSCIIPKTQRNTLIGGDCIWKELVQYTTLLNPDQSNYASNTHAAWLVFWYTADIRFDWGMNFNHFMIALYLFSLTTKKRRKINWAFKIAKRLSKAYIHSQFYFLLHFLFQIYWLHCFCLLFYLEIHDSFSESQCIIWYDGNLFFGKNGDMNLWFDNISNK